MAGPNVQRQMQMGFLAVPAGMAIQLLGTLLIARHFQPEIFGVFAFIFAIMNIADFITELGLGIIITKKVAEGTRPPADYIAASLPLITAVAVVVALIEVVVVCAVYGLPKAGLAALLAAVNILIFGNSMVLSCTLRGLGRIGEWYLGFVGQKIIVLGIVVGIIKQLPANVAWGVGAWTIANTLVLLYYAQRVWGDVWRGQLSWNVREILKLVGESIPVGLISVANQLGLHMDLFILKALTDDVIVGIYSAGQRLINPARTILAGAVTVPTFPGLCRMAAQEDKTEFGRLTTRLAMVQWLSALPMSIVAWAAAPYVVHWLLGPGFEDSTNVIRITSWALAPSFFILQFRYCYVALGQQRRFLVLNIIYLCIKGVGFATLLALLPREQRVWGACYATVGSEVLLALMVRAGIVPLGVRTQVARRIVGPTLGTAGVLALMWWLSETFEPAMLVLAAIYLMGGAWGVNKLLRKVRRDLRKSGADGSVATAPAV